MTPPKIRYGDREIIPVPVSQETWNLAGLRICKWNSLPVAEADDSITDFVCLASLEAYCAEDRLEALSDTELAAELEAFRKEIGIADHEALKRYVLQFVRKH